MIKTSKVETIKEAKIKSIAKSFIALLFLATSIQSNPSDSICFQAIRNYFQYIAMHKYKEAYSIFSQVSILCKSKDSSAVGFGYPQTFEKWKIEQENFDSIAILSIVEVKWKDFKFSADGGSCEAIFGLRCFRVGYYVHYLKPNLAEASGNTDRFIWMVQGNDLKCRILGIGTGP